MKCAVENTSVFFFAEMLLASRKFLFRESLFVHIVLDLCDCCCGSLKMIKSILVINTSGKARLLKFYEHKVQFGDYLLMKF